MHAYKLKDIEIQNENYNVTNSHGTLKITEINNNNSIKIIHQNNRIILKFYWQNNDVFAVRLRVKKISHQLINKLMSLGLKEIETIDTEITRINNKFKNSEFIKNEFIIWYLEDQKILCDYYAERFENTIQLTNKLNDTILKIQFKQELLNTEYEEIGLSEKKYEEISFIEENKRIKLMNNGRLWIICEHANDRINLIFSAVLYY